MKLSVIIVNYNSRDLLKQCLDSVKTALNAIEAEIIVVDNNSADGSKEFLASVENPVRAYLLEKNTGFAKACNLGFKTSSGKYILFLNPDTIISDSSISDCIAFLKSSNEAGAVGVRMIDGKGNFLKESKRGFPSPGAAFFKLFGFAKLFPRSPLFAKYYAGHLPEKEMSEVEVLSGAFMMIKREIFENTGGFDESFFMYGEDIDLSYRIIQSGFKNYYLGNITITHLKGGSTRYNAAYVKTFYGAMNYFVKKHYEEKKSFAFLWFLYAGIRVRKTLAMIMVLFR